jgi:hypothetical protein
MTQDAHLAADCRAEGLQNRREVRWTPRAVVAGGYDLLADR